MDADALVAQAHAAIKAGQDDEAASLLARALRADPRHERAWLSLALVVHDQDQVIECLNRVLALDPRHRQAKALLKRAQDEKRREEVLRQDKGRLPGLGKFLLQERAITLAQLEAALEAQRKAAAAGKPKRLGEILIHQGAVSRKQVQEAAHAQLERFNEQFVD